MKTEFFGCFQTEKAKNKEVWWRHEFYQAVNPTKKVHSVDVSNEVRWEDRNGQSVGDAKTNLWDGLIVTCSLQPGDAKVICHCHLPCDGKGAMKKNMCWGPVAKGGYEVKKKHDWLMIGCWKVRNGTLWNKIPCLSTQFWVSNRQPSWPFKTSRHMSWWRWQPHESMNQYSLKGSRILIGHLKWTKKMWDLHLSLVNSLARLWVPSGRVFFQMYYILHNCTEVNDR